MPFQVIKTNGSYKLKKLTDGSISKKTFKTKKSAINTAKVWLRYRRETPVVKGNTIGKK
jgi:hypothetical protein|tara:strand:+ start:1382 stop:1558 length:177 start_codon:yes stop_codon:yes gene_type:complete